MLTWEQIRTMHRAGMAFGSHTLSHPILSRMKPAEAEKELLESKRILEEQIGSPVKYFAYPFGQAADCGEAAQEVVRCGYTAAVTTMQGVNTTGADLYHLRRVQLGQVHSPAMFALRLNRLFLHADNSSHREAMPPSPEPEGAPWGNRVKTD